VFHSLNFPYEVVAANVPMVAPEAVSNEIVAVPVATPVTVRTATPRLFVVTEGETIAAAALLVEPSTATPCAKRPSAVVSVTVTAVVAAAACVALVGERVPVAAGMLSPAESDV
tara:strand:- start:2853 stop:3194 length:342 start_codon:yes stop_codon:yes gene_type:complete